MVKRRKKTSRKASREISKRSRRKSVWDVARQISHSIGSFRMSTMFLLTRAWFATIMKRLQPPRPTKKRTPLTKRIVMRAAPVVKDRTWSVSPYEQVVVKRGMAKPASTVVATGPNNLQVTKKDCLLLKGSRWLNDVVVNLYCGLLCLRKSNYHKTFAFNSFFYTKCVLFKNKGHCHKIAFTSHEPSIKLFF